MHIPDNYLSPATCAVMGAVMLPVWTVAVRKVRKELTKERLPLLGVCAAFSFLVMMLNVPLPGGTTGHAVGGALIAALIGPWAACISISVALLIQALLFGDGGILAFGANCFNMAFVLPFLSFAIFSLTKRFVSGRKGELIGLGLGAYVGLNVAALCASILFGLQPLIAHDSSGLPLYCPYSLGVAIPAMMIPHLLVAGVVEVAFSVAVFAYVSKLSPGTIRPEERSRPAFVYALVAVLIAACPLGLLAAGTAWGEWGAEEISSVASSGAALGYVPSGMESGVRYEAPMPDYALAGLPEWAGYLLSAVAGVAILLICFKMLSLLKRREARA
jgi:cobalt/nickel transport system permease protein